MTHALLSLGARPNQWPEQAHPSPGTGDAFAQAVDSAVSAQRDSERAPDSRTTDSSIGERAERDRIEQDHTQRDRAKQHQDDPERDTDERNLAGHSPADTLRWTPSDHRAGHGVGYRRGHRGDGLVDRSSASDRADQGSAVAQIAAAAHRADREAIVPGEASDTVDIDTDVEAPNSTPQARAGRKAAAGHAATDTAPASGIAARSATLPGGTDQGTSATRGSTQPGGAAAASAGQVRLATKEARAQHPSNDHGNTNGHGKTSSTIADTPTAGPASSTAATPATTAATAVTAPNPIAANPAAPGPTHPAAAAGATAPSGMPAALATTALAQPEVANILAQLRGATDGSYQLRAQVHPAELGAVSITATLRGGVLSVLLSPDPTAQQAVSQSLPQLRDFLADQGFTGVDVGLGSSAHGNDASGEQDPHPHGSVQTVGMPGGEQSTAADHPVRHRRAYSGSSLDRML